jgi:hypothetical protein
MKFRNLSVLSATAMLAAVFTVPAIAATGYKNSSDNGARAIVYYGSGIPGTYKTSGFHLRDAACDGKGPVIFFYSRVFGSTTKSNNVGCTGGNRGDIYDTSDIFFEYFEVCNGSVNSSTCRRYTP